MAEANTVVLEGDVLDYWKAHAPMIEILLEESDTPNSLTITHDKVNFLTDEQWAMFKHWAPILPQYPGSVYVKNTMENLEQGYSEDPFRQMLAALGYISPKSVLARPRAPIVTNGNMGEYSAERIAQGAITRKRKKAALRKAKAREERLARMYREYYGNNYNSYNNSLFNNISEPNWIKYQLNNNEIANPNNEYANYTRAAQRQLKQTQTRRRGRERLPNRKSNIQRRLRNREYRRRVTQRMKNNRIKKVTEPEE